MINIKLSSHNQYSSINLNQCKEEDVECFPSCNNTITFDEAALIIKSEYANEEVCTILFDITPKFIKELKLVISTLEQTVLIGDKQ